MTRPGLVRVPLNMFYGRVGQLLGAGAGGDHLAEQGQSRAWRPRPVGAEVLARASGRGFW
ncbi:MAG TPA: hypothetical protein VLJ59_17090 [Mycobacteriales bacterium]|nr:hypothetical protein [Mycobacteriales bacterium]